MNVDQIIENLGLTREQLFQFYRQYKKQLDICHDEYVAVFRAFDLIRFPREYIFYFVLGLKYIEEEMYLIKGEDKNGKNIHRDR